MYYRVTPTFFKFIFDHTKIKAVVHRPITDAQYSLENYEEYIDILNNGIPVKGGNLFERIAYVYRDLNNKHFLNDGNKQFANFFLHLILEKNNYEMDIREDPSYQFAIKLVIEGKSLKEIADWIERYAKRRDDLFR